MRQLNQNQKSLIHKLKNTVTNVNFLLMHQKKKKKKKKN